MKFFAIATVAAAALTLAACGEKNEETAPSNAATETVTLNDDGSVATEAAPEATATEAVK